MVHGNRARTRRPEPAGAVGFIVASRAAERAAGAATTAAAAAALAAAAAADGEEVVVEAKQEERKRVETEKEEAQSQMVVHAGARLMGEQRRGYEGEGSGSPRAVQPALHHARTEPAPSLLTSHHPL